MPAATIRPFTRTADRRARGFTLTELLIVIAIIAVLAALITAAAVNAIRRSRQARITLEINQIAGSLEQFKTDYGAYPPNGFVPTSVSSPPPAGSIGALVRSDFIRMFKGAFPRHQEPVELIEALAGITPQNSSIVPSGPLQNGMTPAEALYFWLAGFSSDPKYPISGSGGPSFINVVGGEVLENRNRRYEFDLGRLGPRNDDGSFNESIGRFITYQIVIDGNVQNRRINFWQYTPPGSEQPLAYFDTSRHKPVQYDPPYTPPGSSFKVYALKKIREGFPGSATPQLKDLTFIDSKKFQVLHCGLDDDWGNFGESATGAAPTTPVNNQAVFPQGPFIGPIADTLTNFTEGELADAAEE